MKKECEPCEKNGECDSGTCDPVNKVCATVLPDGSRCSPMNGCKICSDAERCGKYGKCVARSEKCGHCVHKRDCIPGLVCKRLPEAPWRGKCAMPMKTGGKCHDACWGCQDGLTCEDGICRDYRF